jgi:hypothetical protein
MKRAIYTALLIAAFLLILGVAGGSDQETITETQMNAYLILAVFQAAVAFFGLNLEDRREANDRKWREQHGRE